MKFLLFLTSASVLALSGCMSNYHMSNSSTSVTKSSTTINKPAKIKNKVVKTIGYGSILSFKNKPKAQQKLLAIRAAKLDAYRTLAEEIYGIKIDGQTTVKDMVVVNDSYRTTVDAMVRGAHIDSITEKKNGLIEAEVSMTFTPRYTTCLFNPYKSCLNSANQFQSEIIDVQAEKRKIEVEGERGFGIFEAPQSNFHRD